MSDTTMMTTRRALMMAGVAVVQGVAAILLLELILHVTGTGFIWAREAPMYQRSDGATEIEHKPGFSGVAFGGAVRINAYGLRERWDVAPVGKKRILAVGDSLLFGFGVGDGNTIPDYLEAILAGKGIDCEVMNAGVNGYKTSNEAAFIEKWSGILKPDAILVLMIVNDWDTDALVCDEWGRLARPGQFPPLDRPLGALEAIKRWFARNSYAYNFLSAVWWRKVRPSLFQAAEPPAADHGYTPSQWAAWEESASRLARFQADSGIPVIVALSTVEVPADHIERATRFLQAQGIACLPYDPALGQSVQDRGGYAALNPLFRLWWDAHPTGAGYRRIAQVIADGPFRDGEDRTLEKILSER